MNEFTKLGKSGAGPSKDLDKFPTPKGITEVKFITKELTSNCPVTNQPDLYTVILTFAPDKACIESKSLKLYYWSFRDEALFGENLASEIAHHVFKTIKPFWVSVEVEQQVRGGLIMTATAYVDA